MESGNNGSHGHEISDGTKIATHRHSITIPHLLLNGASVNDGIQPGNPPELLQSGTGRTERSHSSTSCTTDGSKSLLPLTNIALLNIQGLKPRTIPSKVPFIQDLLIDDKLLFIALTETWLRDHLDAEVNVEGYKLFCQDRIRTRFKRKGHDGSGMECYLKNDIAAGTDTS